MFCGITDLINGSKSRSKRSVLFVCMKYHKMYYMYRTFTYMKKVQSERAATRIVLCKYTRISPHPRPLDI